MELECIKYKEKMDADDALCNHPGDYCKYRTSCIIHFIGKEKIGAKLSNRDSSEQHDNDKEQRVNND